MKYKIGIMTCYFGTFPSWMQLWLNSCAANNDIDFFIVTDGEVDKYIIPSNVYVIEDTMIGFRKRLEKAIGQNCVLTKPYKLCDYKPMYGVVYEDIFDGYDFWGHCDVDLIFGHLRTFLTDKILDKYDKLFEMGHLSIYRNIDHINRMYLLDGAMIPWTRMIKEANYCGFDEHTGIMRICEVNNISTFREVVCADIDPHWRMFVMMDENSISGKMRFKNYNHQVFTYENGHTYQYYIDKTNCINRNEVLYVHFMRKKPACFDKNGERFCITHKSFNELNNRVVDKNFIIENDYCVEGIKKKYEYARYFVLNALNAIKNREFFLRVRLRINRIRGINIRNLFLR